MLRIILRNTHNALLFACILLLLCSFERLCRYDFAQIPTQANANLGDETLQVDHFVFWGGIPAFESSGQPQNSWSVRLSKFKSWASHYKPPILAAAPTTPEEVEMLLIHSAASLSEANRLMKRQILYHNPRKEAGDSTTSAEEASTEVGSNTASAEPIAAPKPNVGFVLLLPSCDRETILRWQNLWKEQVLNQPFQFHILLAASVDENCIITLQKEFQNTEDTTYQISRSDPSVTGLQTCLLEDLDEFVYYDASRRLRSSPTLRRFQRSPTPSFFQCSGEPYKPAAFCNGSVLDCPWFPYVSPGGTATTS